MLDQFLLRHAPHRLEITASFTFTQTSPGWPVQPAGPVSAGRWDDGVRKSRRGGTNSYITGAPALLVGQAWTISVVEARDLSSLSEYFRRPALMR
jgi:hypothetical protein